MVSKFDFKQNLSLLLVYFFSKFKDKENGKGKEKKPAKIRNVVRKPQPKLDANRLCGDRGLKNLHEMFETFKPKGSGHEVNKISFLEPFLLAE